MSVSLKKRRKQKSLNGNGETECLERPRKVTEIISRVSSFEDLPSARVPLFSRVGIKFRGFTTCPDIDNIAA